MARIKQVARGPRQNLSISKTIGRRKSTWKMSWTQEKCQVLAAAVIAAKYKWSLICRLFASEYPSDARDCAAYDPSPTGLQGRLNAQWGERNKSTSAKWRHTVTSEEEIEQQASVLLARLRATVRRLTGNAANARAPDTPVDTSLSQTKAPDSGYGSDVTSAAFSPNDHLTESTPDALLGSRSSGVHSRQQRYLPITPLGRTNDTLLLTSGSPVTTSGTRSHHVPNPTNLMANRPGMGRASREQLAARLEATRAIVHGPYRAPLREQAQPPPSTLVYRFYHPDATHVGNLPATKGFIAGYFLSTKGGIATPLPHDAEFLFNAIEHHVNRANIPSPFISVANDFFWSLRQAIKLSTRSKPLRISVIDGRQAAGHDGSKAYHLRAYSAHIRERRAYESGGWRPAGMSEFLIWGQIPKEAILADFSVADFLGICNVDANFAAVFRPQYLKLAGYTHRVRGLMRQDHPVIDDASMNAMCILLNSVFSDHVLVASSLPEIITKFVSDFVQGWHVTPREELTRATWLALASRFATILKNHLPAASTVSDRAIAKAFLFGVLSGFGEPNWQLDDKLKHKMLANANAYGLTSPDSMFAAEEDPIRAAIRQFTYENVSPQKRFKAIGPEYEGKMNSGVERWWRTTAMGRQQQHAKEAERRRRSVQERLARQQEQASDDSSDEEGTDESQEPQETHVPRHGVRWFEAVVIPRMLPTPAASTRGSPTQPGNSEDSAITIEDYREEDYRMVEEESEEEDEYDFVEHGEANDMDDEDFVMLDAED
ncbi:hypothetical protein KVT40_004065 [Elsinoe batatas]|uniref:DUF7587 domain-containing protein n=1 Tax=Elsinoe batatas TaxID=2601811 RepID=A0A8K0L323_9PEZI|nr:hypothetical protein KVT40_004065 [Elsinoe batatas]